MPIKNRRIRSRRGLSTIITSMMLVAAVAIIGSFLVVWANSSFAVQQVNIANQTAARINLVKEDFVIEDVWFYTDGGQKYANITIRNTGDLSLTVSNVYINNSQVSIIKETITIGQREEIKVQTNWQAGNTQTILVTTERGTAAKQVWKS